MEQARTIYIIDDDKEITALLSGYLEQHGFAVESAEDGEMLMQLMRRAEPDLIVLDVMLPGEDGFSLCRTLLKEWRMPVIFLTAMADTTDRIVGLEIGADDYMSKPFEPRELLARIRSVLRRNGEREVDATERECLHFSGWRLNKASRSLESPGGVMVHLSGAEYRLLRIFLSHPQTVLSRDMLIEQTQGRAAAVFDRSIDVQVSRLRMRLRDNGREEQFIKTVRGDGYLWATPVSREFTA